MASPRTLRATPYVEVVPMFAADTTQDVPLVVPWASMAVSLVIPLAVALVAKQNASSAVKGFITVALSAIAAALTAYVDAGGELPLVDFVSAFFVVLVGSHVSYKTFLKAPAEAIQDAVPGGIGGGARTRLGGDTG